MKGIGRVALGQRGFSLIEQIVSVALITIIATQLLVGMPTLIRGTATSDARVEMQNVARTQVETIKQGPFMSSAQGYPTVAVPDKYAIAIQVEPASTYTYTGQTTQSLTDDTQLITVQVQCVACSDPPKPVIIQFYKVRQ